MQEYTSKSKRVRQSLKGKKPALSLQNKNINRPWGNATRLENINNRGKRNGRG